MPNPFTQLGLRPALTNEVTHDVVSGKNYTAVTYGGFGNGCIKGAVAVPLQGPGYQVVSTKMDAYYAHPKMLDKIQEWGEWASLMGYGQYLIRQISHPRGGPSSDHAGHEIGLEADIAYEYLAADRSLSASQRFDYRYLPIVNHGATTKDGQTFNYVIGNRPEIMRLLPYFEEMLVRIVRDEDVHMVIVNPVIKRHLCETYKIGSEYPQWLSKVRLYIGHDGHFHVRLKCLEGSTCNKNLSIPADDASGCTKLDPFDAGWRNWIKALAKKNFAPRTPGKKKDFKFAKGFPEACKALVRP